MIHTRTADEDIASATAEQVIVLSIAEEDVRVGSAKLNVHGV